VYGIAHHRIIGSLVKIRGAFVTRRKPEGFSVILGAVIENHEQAVVLTIDYSWPDLTAHHQGTNALAHDGAQQLNTAITASRFCQKIRLIVVISRIAEAGSQYLLFLMSGGRRSCSLEAEPAQKGLSTSQTVAAIWRGVPDFRA
jgi:hypothetical protein